MQNGLKRMVCWQIEQTNRRKQVKLQKSNNTLHALRGVATSQGKKSAMEAAIGAELMQLKAYIKIISATI